MANKAIVGRKVGMTQVWDDQNRVVPVTVVKVAPCRVVQIKTPETDGYSALQVTFGDKDPRKLNKPLAGHYEKAGVTPGVTLVELRLDDRGLPYEFNVMLRGQRSKRLECASDGGPGGKVAPHGIHGNARQTYASCAVTRCSPA